MPRHTLLTDQVQPAVALSPSLHWWSITADDTGHLITTDIGTTTPPSGALFARQDSLQIVTTDADYTLSPTSSSNRVLHTAALAAGRTVTISTNAAFAGQTFHITRTGSGAFNLSIGGLKNLAANQWCEIIYTGSAWVLSKFGSL